MNRFSLILGLVTGAMMAHAADIANADRVQFRDGKVWVFPRGDFAKSPDFVSLPFQIRVETNGSYVVAGGKARQLREGETLGRDGMLLRTDGSIIPVMDHLTSNRGRVLMMRDGDYQQVAGEMELGKGTWVRADGKISMNNGSTRHLLDGELFLLTGAALAARDTVTIRDGQVLVQKDGTMIALGAGRTIMMNNGTKVFSDGTFVDFNGRWGSVAAGNVAVIEGVAVRPR